MHASEMKTKAPQQPPDWLELEPGEKYLTSYPAMQVLTSVLLGALIVLALACGVTLIAVILGDMEGLPALFTVLGSVSGIAISYGQFSKQRLYATNKMLVFGQPPRKIQGMPLNQITQLARGSGWARWTISIYGPHSRKPVTKLNVLRTAEVLAELNELCQQAREPGYRE